MSMRHIAIAVIAVCALTLATGIVAAQSPFDGTWKSTRAVPAQVQKMSIVIELKDGIFQLTNTGGTKINIKADGTDQPVQGNSNTDTMAVKVVDDKTVEITGKKDGKILSSSRNTVSADGKTNTMEYLNPDGKVRNQATYTRAAAGPPGSHATSGTWLPPAGPSSIAVTVTYKSTPDGLMMMPSRGVSWDAKFDGKDYPLKAADNTPEEFKKRLASATISLTKVNERSIDVTRKNDGKIMFVEHMTVSADGKTLTANTENKENGTTTTDTFTKE
jgi:hypothetical protein